MKKNTVLLFCAFLLSFSAFAERLADRARKAVDEKKFREASASVVIDGRIALSELDAGLIASSVVRELFRPFSESASEVKSFIQEYAVAVLVTSATVLVSTALLYRFGVNTQNNLATMKL